jgi:hypothetical protein
MHLLCSFDFGFEELIFLLQLVQEEVVLAFAGIIELGEGVT